MCWCRIELVLSGLLGLLCVVHVVSGMCGQNFTSTALESDVIIQGRVLNFSNANRETGLYYAKITIRNPILKGKKIIKKMGKEAEILTLGPFKKKRDDHGCFGPVKKGKQYIFLLNKGRKGSPVKFILQSLPKRRTKKEYKQLRNVLCKTANICKKKKSSKPKIKRVVGPKTTVRTGSKLTFKCYAKAKPTPEYTWYKDGVIINEKELKGMTIKKNKRYSRLQIRRATNQNEGVYTCEAKNAVGLDSKNFSTFSVRDNPKNHRDDTSLCAVQTLCLNGGTCLHNNVLDVTFCMCRPKWTGTRCEVLDAIRIHGQYSRQATLLYERTLIIVGLVIAVLVFIVICIASYFLAKRKRKKFEAKKKRKQLLRANASNSVRMKDSATQSYRTADENIPPGCNNTYQPIIHDSRSFFSGRDNGFNFEAAQRQPLLRHHGTDDVDGSGPESRRRLVASSMYDNFDDPPTATTSPNRSANVMGLTTAEVSPNPEMIEMSPLERRVVDPVSANCPENPKPTVEEDLLYPPSEDSTIPLSQSSPISNTLPDTPSSPTEIHQPSDQTLPPPPPSTEDLDFENYRAPPPPVIPISHSNSSPLRNTPTLNSTDPIAADSSRFPSSNSMPTRLVNNVDNDNIGHGNPSDNHSPLPHSNNPYANFPPSNEMPRQFDRFPFSKYQSDDSLPSYDAAVVLMNGIASGDDGSGDDGAGGHFGNNTPNTIEDLHIIEDDLGLSTENLPRGSFNSSAYPSRQPSVDMESPADYNDRYYNMRRRFSTDKQQSEDIVSPEPFWKRALLHGGTARSHSLDMPSNSDKVNGTGPHHLDSTVSGNQNNMKHDSHNSHNSGKHHHTDDVFDPNDDSTPWDPDHHPHHQHQNSCNSNNANLLGEDEQQDRMNRLKDVRPDQSAIPI